MPFEGGEELYLDPIVQYEEDHWKVKLREVVEPTKVVNHQLYPLRENNI
jgi:hypothetical protein